MRPTYHYDKNHKMIYVGQKVRAGDKTWTVVIREDDGKSPYRLESEDGEIRRLNEFGAQQLEVCNG